MCEITIDEVIGIITPPGQSPDRIEVSGTVTDCNKIAVTINDAGPITIELEDNDTVWTAVFHANTHYLPERFVCKETDLKVHVECVDDTSSCSADADFLLDCRPEEEQCPDVTLEILSISGACAADGTRTVELKATISSYPPDTVYTWDFGNGEEESALLTTNEILQTQSYPADPDQTYLSQFSFILPLGCVGDEIAIGPLAPCPTQCPSGTIEIIDGPSSACIDGKRRVTMRFTVTAGESFTAASIDFGDGTGESPTITAAPGETVSSEDYLDEPIIHDYEAPESGSALAYTPQIVFAPDLDGCDPIPLDPPISISPCESECADYRITDIELELGDCAGSQREITATAIVTGSDSPSSYEWEWSDGHTETTDGPSATHPYETASESLPASVAVVVHWPNGCTDIQTEPFTVDPCTIEYECPEIEAIIPEEGDCLDSGERSVTLVAQVSGIGAGSYSWDFGDGDTATTSGPSSPNHNYEPGTYSVKVTLNSFGPCPEVSFEGEIDVAACPDDPPPPPIEPPPPPPPSWCPILRILGLAALIIGLVLIFGGACSANVPVAIVGGVIAAIGFGLLVAWALLCARFAGGCRSLQLLIEILSLIEIVLVILAIIFGILSIWEIGIPCLIGIVIDNGIVGALLAILTTIFAQLGCQFTRPTLIDRIFGIRVSG